MTATPRAVLLVAAPLLALCAGDAVAQSTLVPAEPSAFERVHLRQTVDSCMFDESRVEVSQRDGVIVVVQPPLQCFAPGPPEVVDIQLGAFAPGDYQAEIRLADDQPAIERIAFTVHPLAQIAVFPPPPHPLADYSGIWWNADESGWGLSLHQGAAHTLFGALYLFDANQQPQWYTLQGGQWLSSTRWQGEILKTVGPWWTNAGWDPEAVKHTVSGSATLDFSMTPERTDRATLSYTIDGHTVSETIGRARF
jgi:hypothetical protein